MTYFSIVKKEILYVLRSELDDFCEIDQDVLYLELVGGLDCPDEESKLLVEKKMFVDLLNTEDLLNHPEYIKEIKPEIGEGMFKDVFSHPGEYTCPKDQEFIDKVGEYWRDIIEEYMLLKASGKLVNEGDIMVKKE